MDKFLPTEDALGRLIQEKAELLYRLLKQVPVDTLGLPHYCLEYFKGSHYRRLFFSIQTSAHLLYRSIRLVNKPVEEIMLMDYGAGVGSLYTLAKMIGCRKVIYNDHLADWQLSAKLIAEAIGVQVDKYIVGDIDTTLEQLALENTRLHIITSRNVLEHIYQPAKFFNTIASLQPGAVVYSSTTANFNNPGSRSKHYLWHRKWEKHYLEQRLNLINQLLPQLSMDDAAKLAKATRGLASSELKEAIFSFSETRHLPDPSIYGTNTCDPVNGVWAENLLPFATYRKLADPTKYAVQIEPGFWDTHYQTSWKNWLGKMFNLLIRINRTIGCTLAPFIYMVAEPIKKV